SYPALPTIDYTLDTGAGDCEDYAILKYVALRAPTSPRSLRAYRQSFSFLDNPPGATRGLDKLRKGGAVYSSRPPLPELPRTNGGGGWSRALVSCPPSF